jgi:GDPmannose 4,6-dehydratase
VKPVALITGIAGQDGSYLSEHLLDSGYEVHGIVRRNSIPENQETRLSIIADKVTTHYGDLADVGSLQRIIYDAQPTEVYNLAAQSHVRISFDVPQFTAATNAVGVLNILEILRKDSKHTKFYQASSSEMFGDSVDADEFQRETTPMHPVSPYGCAKLFGYHITRNYRSAYEIFASNGILFNHESPRRASNFVTSKVIKTALQIKHGLKSELVLGNLDSKRDWGHSKDYVRAMKLILDYEKPMDFVVATGHTHSVRDLVELVFTNLDLDYKEYVKQDPRFMRPQELPYLRGDSSKIRSLLGWEPLISFEEMVDEMMNHWKVEFDKLVL